MAPTQADVTQGAGQTLWMRNDLLEQAMSWAGEMPETKNDLGAH